MGFMEAMVSMMTICIVIGMYVSFASTSALSTVDNLADFDPKSVEITASDGIAIDPGSYLYMFILNKDLRGIRISVDVPYFIEGDTSLEIGETEGLKDQQRYFMLVSGKDGRNLPAIMEVEAFS